jgi:hypothetical protein
MKNILLIVLILLSLQTFSQNRISDHNQIGWFATTITPSISKKLSLHIEYQWRREDFITNWQQSLFRTGVNYKVHPQVTLQAGYAWIKTYAYGEHTLAALPNTFPEHRAYEQVTVNSTIGKTTLQNRLRLEQRWVGRFTSVNSTKPDEWIYLNRFRYMSRLDVPVTPKWYAAVYDEILIGFGKKVGENIFDQNRIALVAGYKFNPTFRAEAGFINQTVQLGREIDNKNVFQYNNGFVISTYINVNK